MWLDGRFRMDPFSSLGGALPISGGLLLVLAAALPLRAEGDTRAYGPHRRVAVLDTANLQQSSGIIASRRNTGIFWTHNDSGSCGPRVWAVRLTESDAAAGVARDLGYVELAGATNVNWEDISAGPENRVYILDGGDNPPCTRADKRIHRFVEPRIDPAPLRLAMTLPFESVRFEYPSDHPDRPARINAHRYDAECLFVHPASGDIYIVTKRDTHDVGTARVYKLPADRIEWNRPTIHVLRYVTDLTEVLGVTASVLSTVTGGDIDSDGRRVLIRRYGFAFEFTLPAGRPFKAIFNQPPRSLSFPGEAQGEAICYSRDDTDIYTTSEVVTFLGIPVGPQRCPLFMTPRLIPSSPSDPQRVPATRPDNRGVRPGSRPSRPTVN